MIYLVNIATIILAIIFVFQLGDEKNKYRIAFAGIIIGLLLHTIEAYLRFSSGKCVFSESTNIIKSLDTCIDYQSGSMLYAQAMIIAGFTVLIVNFFLSRKKKN